MNIIPTPKLIQPEIINANIVSFSPIIKGDIECLEAIEVFGFYVQKLFNISIQLDDEAAIYVEIDESLDDEEYRVEISQSNVIIRAKGNVGVNHAFATILQIMQVRGNNILLPEVTIEDYPDSVYRGMMVDLARNWHSFSYLLSFVDICYFYKVSVLHFHFTDDQSYTLPSDIYPKLSKKGRSYTKKQIQELVMYARVRGVELLPEIDVPGHSKTFAEAYGELFGTNGVICQHLTSMEAMRKLFRELCDMFPYSKYIHIGGDEAYDMHKWTECSECCAYAKSVGIDSDMSNKKKLAELFYAHFISEMAEMCFQNGKQPIVWEGFGKEVNNRISRNIIVMSWENLYQLTSELLEDGFNVINCSWNPMYVVTPLTMWNPEDVYDWSIYTWKATHPNSPHHNSTYKALRTSQILGGQLHAWGDHIQTEYDNVENGIREERQNLIERIPMLAEKTWNVDQRDNYSVFHKRAGELKQRLNILIAR